MLAASLCGAMGVWSDGVKGRWSEGGKERKEGWRRLGGFWAHEGKGDDDS